MFDPTGVSGVPQASARPVVSTPSRIHIAPEVHRRLPAPRLAASIPRSGVEGGGDYWVKQAEILLAGISGAAALDPTMVDDVAHWVFTKDIPAKGTPNEIIDILKRPGMKVERQIVEAAAAMLQLDAVWKMDDGAARSSV